MDKAKGAKDADAWGERVGGVRVHGRREAGPGRRKTAATATSAAPPAARRAPGSPDRASPRRGTLHGGGAWGSDERRQEATGEAPRRPEGHQPWPLWFRVRPRAAARWGRRSLTQRANLALVRVRRRRGCCPPVQPAARRASPEFLHDAVSSCHCPPWSPDASAMNPSIPPVRASLQLQTPARSSLHRAAAVRAEDDASASTARPLCFALDCQAPPVLIPVQLRALACPHGR
ncbi:uncharacterized protein LOC125545290 isoform X2 [Triticum urartu]|uniref:uncharacterized protein LOC125545290 isoform X2 n=1 Tax=Triticum urartu TaxID=4572 RepID=UPI002042FA0E|nr:uncharacterized protein LOC125545290 isoform X2 [Triticum urartu]